MSKYNIIFELRTFVDESIGDIGRELNFVPFIGMNIWFDKNDIKFPKNMPDEGWFKVEGVDYLLKDDVFIVSMKALGDYDVKKE